MNLSYTAILITYNRAEKLNNVVNGIINQKIKPRKFIIINNASTDNTDEIISKYNDQSIIYITADENLGHGAGLALAFKFYLTNLYNQEYIMLFEDDSLANPELSYYMLTYINKHVYALISLEGYLIKLGSRLKPQCHDDKPTEVDFALLDGCIFRSDLLSIIGLPVENWFMMNDDYEYCYRIKQKGYRIAIVKNLYHNIGHIGAKTAPWRVYYQSRNHFHFVKRHMNLFNLINFIILETKRLFGSFGTPKFLLRLKGFVDGFLGIYGKSLKIK